MTGEAKGISNFLVVIGIALLIAVGSFIGSTVMVFLSLEQARNNERHFDCAVSVFAQTEPPKCADIIREFREEGIFPPRESP